MSFDALEPLSRRERTALVRILSASARDHGSLAPRQRAALDAYACVLSSPPLIQSDVVGAARAMIRIWAELGTAAKRAKPRRPSGQKRAIFDAELLDLEEASSLLESITDQVAPATPLIADLLEAFPSEAATEMLITASALSR